GQALPRAGHAADLGLPAELAVGADLAGYPRHLGGEPVQLVDHAVEDDRDLIQERIIGSRQPHAEVAVAYRREAGEQLLQARLIQPGLLAPGIVHGRLRSPSSTSTIVRRSDLAAT